MGVLIILDGGKSHLSSKSILQSKPLFREYLIEIFAHTYSKCIDEILIVSNDDSIDFSNVSLKTPIQIIRPKSTLESGAIFNLQYAINYLSGRSKESEIYISYSDIIIKSSLLNLVEKEVVNIFVDSSLPTLRFRDYCDLVTHDGLDMEYIGLICMTLEIAENLLGSVKSGSLVAQIRQIALESGQKVNVVESAEQWVHIENFRAVPGIMFGSKAENLTWVTAQTLLTVPTFLTLKKREISTKYIQEICTYFRKLKPSMTLIVRSSHHKEDGLKSSNAGKYLSIGDLLISEQEIESAILKVFDSYQDNDPNSEVIVQEQVSDIGFIGVLTSRTVKTMKPYFVIEYALDAQIDAITGGLDVDRKTLFIRRNSNLNSHELDVGFDVSQLINSVIELEDAFGFPALDIEFAISRTGEIHVLQVRPLVCEFAVFEKLEASNQETDLRLPATVKELGLDLVNVNGKSLLSIMSDWNPAEILGRNPSPLATSIYRNLVTDVTWSIQRFENGYHDMRGTPLMHTIFEQNYVDVLASLSSFIPASVSKSTKHKLLMLAYSQLRDNPTLHDRIEFQFFPTSTTLLRKKWNEKLSPYLTEIEISDLLIQLNKITQISISRNYERNLEPKIELYDPNINSSFLGYLESSVRPLVLEFAHAARCAFISKVFLSELIEVGALSRERVNEFYSSISTVTSEFLFDAWSVKSGKSSFEYFVDKYKHLRPSTYDLKSKSYGENFENYLRPIVENATKPEAKLHIWTSQEIANIEGAIKESGLVIATGHFIDFLSSAIRHRERYKFEFTKGIDSLFKFIKESESNRISVDLFSGMKIDELDTIFRENSVKRSVADRNGFPHAKDHTKNPEKDVVLPEVLFEDSPMSFFHAQNKTPYFPVRTVALGSALKLSNHADFSGLDFEGKIICIESADPGYDFIFGLKVAGLVTAFGGPNSHMSVRCAELNLPSAIGLGSFGFNAIESGDQLLLDSVNLRFENLSERDKF
jgi:hypothetical protein